MGELQGVHHGAKVCDFWIGPVGDRIYHFHDPYPQDEDARVAVGVPQWGPQEEFDPGVVFIVAVTDKPPWLAVLFRSCFAEFPESEFHLVNGDTPSGQNRRGQHFSDVPEERRPLRDRLFAMNGTEHHVRMSVFLDVPDRFLMKLALGFGALFFTADFQNSPDAALLRTALWTRSADEREKIKIRGNKFLGEKDPIAAISDFEGCHVLAGIPVGNLFSLILRLSGGEAHGIMVSGDPRHWHGTRANEGAVFVIAPGLRACVGPLTLPEYIADFQGRRDPHIPRHPELIALLERLSRVPPRPPI